MTRTFSILKISKSAYEEIKQLLKATGIYDHAILEAGEHSVIDMHGIAIQAQDLDTQEEKEMETQPKSFSIKGRNPNDELKIESVDYDELKFTATIGGNICELAISVRNISQAMRTILPLKNYQGFFVDPVSDLWYPCTYIPGEGAKTAMPIADVPLTIRCVVAKKVEFFLAKYVGSGQFRIETKAELIDDGSHRKLHSGMSAHFVTHYSYCFLPIIPDSPEG
jgi:hypothetical protein